MRIISGLLKGRIFRSPGGKRTHPMSEKARGAIFNTLGDIKGLSFLDPYAGSGAIAFEALSRGANRVVAIDADKKAYRSIKASAEDLGVDDDEFQVVKMNCKVWSNTNIDRKFDVIVCDPPYDDIRPDVIRLLTRHMVPTSIFVLSYPGSEKPLDIKGLTVAKAQKYGDIQLIYYRR